MTKSNYGKTRIGERELQPETLMMSYGYDPSLSEGAVKPPVFLTSTFVFPTAEDGEEFFNVTSGRKPLPEGETAGLIYSRFNHPNVEIVEDRLALMEGAEAAVVLSSGMGAISATFMAFLRPGDVILHSSPLYGGTEVLIRNILPEFGIQSVEFHDGLNHEELATAAEKAKSLGRVAMIYAETPGNPTNALVDFDLITNLAKQLERDTGLRPVTVIDNTMLGPVFQRPVQHGIDLSVYSLTKYVGGHSDLVAGGVCGKAEAVKKVWAIRGAMGLNLDPHTSWMLSRSLETLTLRMERAATSALKVAAWLAGNSYLPGRVLHPEAMEGEIYQAVYKRQCSGGGSTFSFVFPGTRSQAFSVINALSLFKSAVSLGGTESLVSHPASTTHSGVPDEVRNQVGIEEGLIRFSIGLEHPDDLIADLENAFRTVIKRQAAAE
ncbi:cystathionine gamma-synthase family protein [Pelagibius sp. Alg239-R121]|uniref:cystathionine gamma-synthase family protein n=1 Tax=Pelagibius sp. Alg239-R121 TaxID=2993448 RepID=UPI0024A60DD5|nr:cystathionine gamma-synthase family protein [Pelagibius sp. Alg239-R121]